MSDHIKRATRAIQSAHDEAMPVIAEAVDRALNDDRMSHEQRADVILGGLHRRRFLFFGGAAVLSSAVLAACGGKSSGSSSSASSTSTTSNVASNKDITILRAASSLEEVAVAVYQKAIDSNLVTNQAVATALGTFQTQHKAHSNFFQNQTVAGGGKPFKLPNPVLMNTTVSPRLAGLKTQADVLQLAFDLERIAAATYQADVGLFDDIEFNQKVMTVGAIEARHVAFLAPFVGKPVNPAGAFESTQGAAGTAGV